MPITLLGKILTGSSLTVVLNTDDGEKHCTLVRSDDRFERASKALEKGDLEAVVRAMERLPEPPPTVSTLPAELRTTILRAKGKISQVSLDAFTTRLAANPCRNAVASLASHVEKHGLFITRKGFLVTYKRVRDNLRSWYDSSFQYTVGQVASVPRDQCAPPDVSIGFGLHSTPWQCLRHWYSSGKVLQLLVDPADFVAAPPDSTLWRACNVLPVRVMEDALSHPDETTLDDDGDSGDSAPPAPTVDRVFSHVEANRTAGVVEVRGTAPVESHGITWLIRKLKLGLLVRAGLTTVPGNKLSMKTGYHQVVLTALSEEPGACPVEVDSDGGVLIPLDLMKQASLTPIKANAGYVAVAEDGRVVVTPKNPGALAR